MKRLLSITLLLLALARPAFSQPASVFINDGTITSPLTIDATNFENFGLFDIAFNSFNSNNISTLLLTTLFTPFDFSDVLYYTNRGFMASDTGFIFDDAPSTEGSRRASGSFGNANLGEISAGSFTNMFFGGVVFFIGTTPTLTVTATNIVNTGLLDVGINGYIGLAGQNLDLARGTVHVEGLADISTVNSGTNIIITGDAISGTSLDFGIFDDYWGIGLQTNQLSVANFGVPPSGSDSSPSSKVTFFPGGTTGFESVFPPDPEAFLYTNEINPSNFIYQAVFVNTNILANGVSTAVGFEQGKHGFQIPIIQWSAVPTNGVTGVLITNTLYLEDAFGSDTNLALAPAGNSLTGQPFFVPTNYTITRFFPFFPFLNPSNAVYNSSIFTNSFPVTNQYSALGVILSPTTTFPDPSSSVASITNIPGRISIIASNNLDLTRATITGANYLNLVASNNFVGSAGADMIYPFADINLGTTNATGTLIVSNLVAPSVPFFVGTIQAYSARWTNIIAGVITNTFITNEYHVLIVDAEIQPTSPVQLNTLTLRGTNIYISDWLNVASNLLLNAEQVTIASNACGAATPTGQINVLSPNILWSTSFPVLENLTNWGLISLSNTVYFAGVRENPYFTSNFTEPYESLVNHGEIISSGITIWSQYFENTGSGAEIITNCSGVITNVTNYAYIFSSFGPFSLQATNALMLNGAIEAAFIGDIGITSGSLTISNHILFANGALTLTVTNLLTDLATNSPSSNFWQLADGINLPMLPTNANLLGTTIYSTCPGNLEVDNLWAGLDLGPTVAGFLNNAAIGQLILNGGNNSSTFFFSGPDATNAIYIDQIVLENGATNRGSQNVNGQNVPYYTAVDVNAGMTVYFADAVANGEDISEKLNGNLTISGGHVIWVPAYAGFFSSTNITYPSGITYTLNRALAESPDIDSSGTGTNNALNPTPIFESEDIHLSMSFTTNKSAVVSWVALAESSYGVATNILYSSANLLSTNWVPVYTNFSTAGVNQRVYYTNNAPGNGPLYYRVLVEPPQP